MGTCGTPFTNLNSLFCDRIIMQIEHSVRKIYFQIEFQFFSAILIQRAGLKQFCRVASPAVTIPKTTSFRLLITLSRYFLFPSAYT